MVGVARVVGPTVAGHTVDAPGPVPVCDATELDTADVPEEGLLARLLGVHEDVHSSELKKSTLYPCEPEYRGSRQKRDSPIQGLCRREVPEVPRRPKHFLKHLGSSRR